MKPTRVIIITLMFVDRAVITFIAGKGGNGCVSFRREKFIPKGGPDGGDGGDGADIILTSNKNHHSLVDFKFKNIIRAPKGAHGQGANKTGKKGIDKVLNLPPGTVVKTYPDERLIFDFKGEGMNFTIVKGGKGGHGNVHFKSSTNQAPRFAQKGKPGESVKVILELKLIAFAGLVGLPNAGKSTLLSKISGAKPKIADYPFTTLTPHLGVVYQDYESLVVADIPGIIAGAHKGEGMGLSFLKHIERNKVLIFLLDVSPYSESPPLKTYYLLEEELKFYSTALLRKKRLVVANKIDLLDPDPGNENRKNLEPLQDHCHKENLPYLEISAVKEINLNKFKNKLFELYHEV
ncbi:MAG: GTPase ObgE [Candidatus Aminicenantes bacterium]